MTNNNIHGTGANGATRQLAITLPVYIDGDQCGNGADNCPFAYHASYGWYCGAFNQLLKRDKNKNILRCDKCHWQFDQKEEESGTLNLEEA